MMECTGITVLLIFSFILGIVGAMLLPTIAFTIVGLACIIISLILFLTSFILLIRMIYRISKFNGGLMKGIYSLTGWCKANVLLCSIVFISNLVSIIIGSIKK